MNFYASVAMRAELFPYCLFFSGTCCCEDFYNQRLLCTKPNQNHLHLFSSLQVTGWRVLFRIWKSHFHVCLFSPVLLISIWWLPVFFQRLVYDLVDSHDSMTCCVCEILIQLQIFCCIMSSFSGPLVLQNYICLMSLVLILFSIWVSALHIHH